MQKQRRASQSLTNSPSSSLPQKTQVQLIETMMNSIRKPYKRSSFAYKIQENRLKKGRKSGNLFANHYNKFQNYDLIEKNPVVQKQKQTLEQLTIEMSVLEKKIACQTEKTTVIKELIELLIPISENSIFNNSMQKKFKSISLTNKPIDRVFQFSKQFVRSPIRNKQKLNRFSPLKTQRDKNHNKYPLQLRSTGRGQVLLNNIKIKTDSIKNEIKTIKKNIEEQRKLRVFASNNMHKFSQMYQKLEFDYKLGLVKSYESLTHVNNNQNSSIGITSASNSRISSFVNPIISTKEPFQLQRISENISDQLNGSKNDSQESQVFWGSSRMTFTNNESKSKLFEFEEKSSQKQKEKKTGTQSSQKIYKKHSIFSKTSHEFEFTPLFLTTQAEKDQIAAEYQIHENIESQIQSMEVFLSKISSTLGINRVQIKNIGNFQSQIQQNSEELLKQISILDAKSFEFLSNIKEVQQEIKGYLYENQFDLSKGKQLSDLEKFWQFLMEPGRSFDYVIEGVNGLISIAGDDHKKKSFSFGLPSKIGIVKQIFIPDKHHINNKLQLKNKAKQIQPKAQEAFPKVSIQKKKAKHIIQGRFSVKQNSRLFNVIDRSRQSCLVNSKSRGEFSLLQKQQPKSVTLQFQKVQMKKSENTSFKDGSEESMKDKISQCHSLTGLINKYENVFKQQKNLFQKFLKKERSETFQY